MKIKQLLFVLLAVMASKVTLAQGPGWTEWSEVVEIVNTSNGGVNVRLSPELTNCVSQSGYGAKFASIYPTHPGIDRIQSNLLAAMVAKKKVKLYFNNNECTVVEARVLN